MRLYEINDLYEEAFSIAIDEETGEIKNNDFVNFLDEIDEEKEKKVLNIACFIKNIKAEASAIKAEKDKLAKRQKVCDNKAEHLKIYLQLNISEGEKYKDARAAISWRKSSSVFVNCDPETLPREYCKVRIEPHKELLKKILESGQEIEGVEIVTKNNLQVK